jgi:hypothetical protein
MANPTTNYGFVLPAPTDLVTDLPADFDVALQGVDTRLKALQPGTTLGDLAYSSATANTNTRLGIGSTGQVLTVAAGVPSWAAAPTGGMTLLSTTTLSGTTTTVSSINQTYTDLHILIVNATASASYRPRFYPNGSADLACVVNISATTLQNSTQLQATNAEPWATGAANAITLIIKNYASTSQYKTVQAYGSSNNEQACSFLNLGFINIASAITSFAYTTIAGTSSFSGGSMLIYGVK